MVPFIALSLIARKYWDRTAIIILTSYKAVPGTISSAVLKDGEIWRLWTGQLVHSSWAHLGQNLVGLAVRR